MTKQFTNINRFKPLPKSRGRIGMYLWSGSNKQASSSSGTNCPLSIDIFAEPCEIIGDVFTCGSTGQGTTPTDVVNITGLSVGDEFTTKDYTITVTEVSGSQASGWTGKGKLSFNFLKLPNSPLAIQIPIEVKTQI